MRASERQIVAIQVCVAGLLAVSVGWSQGLRDRLDAMRINMRQLKEAGRRLPEIHMEALSGGARNAIHLADRWETLGPRMAYALSHNFTRSKTLMSPAIINPIQPGTQVSDPSADFVYSVETGFTKSETSTAWCGSHVAVGFNDSGSVPESLLFGPGGVSFAGIAISTDQGASFHDLGFLNAGANPNFYLMGDPALGCADASTFYYASISLDFSLVPVSSISLSKSTDGGLTFGDPVAVVSKDLATHFLDKDWMAVDPTNTNRLFVTYTDFDTSGTVCGLSAPGVAIPRVGIELVSSADGGLTWTPTPIVIDQVCGPNTLVQGSQVTVGPAGEVYVAWENASNPFIREIRIRKSVDSGATFAPYVKVDNVVCVGDCYELEGGFRALANLGSLVVDRSGTRTNGYVYITWQDGRNLQAPDFASGLYGYSDVLFSRSTNGSATWSPAVRVNNNHEPLPSGLGTDQYQPGAAVDNLGRIGVCWYDRRMDPRNLLIDRYCGVSTDAGITFTNMRQSWPSWAPIHGSDVFIDPLYMGDYDVVASDFTKTASGFIQAYQVISRRAAIGGTPEAAPNVFATTLH